MKLLSKLFKGNDPEGIREAMKLCYQKASGHNFLFDIDPKKHNLGMILALSSRYLTFGIERSPEYLSMELAPFFMISSQLIAVNALCEYVVFKELPTKANSNSLKKVLIDNIKYNVNSIWYPIVASCFQNNSDIPWVVFLKDEYFKSCYVDKNLLPPINSKCNYSTDIYNVDDDYDYTNVNWGKPSLELFTQLPDTILNNKNIDNVFFYKYEYNNFWEKTNRTYFDYHNKCFLWNEYFHFNTAGDITHIERVEENDLIDRYLTYEYKDKLLFQITNNSPEFEYYNDNRFVPDFLTLQNYNYRKVNFNYDNFLRVNKAIYEFSNSSYPIIQFFIYNSDGTIDKSIVHDFDGKHIATTFYSYFVNGFESQSFTLDKYGDIRNQYINEYINNKLYKRYYIRFKI